VGLTLPAGFGWNVTTIFWIQTTAIEVGIAAGIWGLYRVLAPIIERKDKIVAEVDRWTAPNPADEELRRKREPRA
jgi:hypothetical protein